MRKTSHQQKIDPQNGRKGKDTYALALSRFTTLVATERNEEKENTRPTATVIAQVDGGFKACGFVVSLAKSTVNRYIQNNMVGSAPLARGYEGAPLDYQHRRDKASLDGSNTQAGGCPAMSYWDPHLPQIMKSVAKSPFECTAIFGSSRTGELVPVHL